eukprot:TRINITY_DN18358_c0_g1_i1.p1 TRINITY_DN18358_c0_g1~~TRINITY_DN18358_c0_g1_i1.p1  ORF type:complete len:189 (+),score=21.82 TRINITY_DN18358_c0_g1_i1:109-675(+)
MLGEIQTSITSTIDVLKQMNFRTFLNQGANFGLVISSALIIWKILILVSMSPSPIVVVLSGSMEPGFYRGDLLFLTNITSTYNVGDIVVYSLGGREIPIVHRIMQIHEKEDGGIQFLTKGDNNSIDDVGLYREANPHQNFLEPSDLVGKVEGMVPYVGMVTIIMNDYPWVKYAVIGMLGLFVLSSREE